MTLNAVVIGAGRWGTLHARKLAAHPDARLVGIVDVNRHRASRLAGLLGVASWGARISDLDVSIDVASVATSIESLNSVCLEALRADCHVLVEKPVSVSAQAIKSLVRESDRRGRVVSVGFLERFNPAIPQPEDFARRLCFQRSSNAPAMMRDIGLDWAIHDLDLLNYLTGEDWTVFQHRCATDRITICLEAASGAEARILCSGGRGPKRRSMWVDGKTADLLATSFDALGAEIDAFLRTVRGDKDPRLASLHDAIRALQLLESARALSAAA